MGSTNAVSVVYQACELRIPNRWGHQGKKEGLLIDWILLVRFGHKEQPMSFLDSSGHEILAVDGCVLLEVSRSLHEGEILQLQDIKYFHTKGRANPTSFTKR